MSEFFIQKNRTKIKIPKRIFTLLLERTHAVDLAPYRLADDENHISFSSLREICEDVNVPYPLFFAPLETVQYQIEDDEKNLQEKFPSKNESVMTPRGVLQLREVDWLVRDIGRKQEFLKRRIFPDWENNAFIGSQAGHFKAGTPNADIAKQIREFFNINLREFRGGNKRDALSYLRDKIEAENIFVSFSSHNRMPQNLKKDSLLSGICIKDKKFPWIFINARDGDEKPLILETDGRQIFTLILMLVCIAANKFAFSSKSGRKLSPNRKIYSITGEVLLPEADCRGLGVQDIDVLKTYAGQFKITPSMLLSRLSELGEISLEFAQKMRKVLKEEIKEATQPPRSPKPVTAYGKYNGEKFSRSVVRGILSKTVSSREANSLLFKRGKANTALMQAYIAKYG